MTNEAKHTPGPWLCEASNGDAYELAPANENGKPDWNREIASVISGWADAQLITAAPDLLHAAQRAWEHNNHRCLRDEVGASKDDGCNCVSCCLKNAIAKATGATS